MIRHDPDLLEYFRNKPACEECGHRPFYRGLQPHHIVCRGMGGGSRLDVALNLVALCLECHEKLQEGKENRDHCLAIVAKREGLEGPDQVQEAIWRLLRQPKA